MGRGRRAPANKRWTWRRGGTYGKALEEKRVGLVAKAVGAGFRILAVGVWKLASWVIWFSFEPSLSFH